MATVTIPMPAVEWGAADAAYVVDYAGVALRDYATRPAFDPAAHAIKWTEAAGGAPDLVLGTYRANRDDTGSHEWIWRIVAPYTPGQSGSPEVRYPTLPAAFYDFNPKAGDVTSLERLVTMKVPGGYGAARVLALDSDIPTPIAGATGRIVYEELFAPPAPTAQIRRTLPRGRFTLHAR